MSLSNHKKDGEGKRLTVGFLSLASCNGCHLAAAVNALGDRGLLPAAVELFHIPELRLAQRGKWPGHFDVLFVEGAVTTMEEEEDLRQYASRTSYLVAMGACAATAGVCGLRPQRSVDEARRGEHGKLAQEQRPIPPRPIHEVVPVDLTLPGCPISEDEFLYVLCCVVSGGKPTFAPGPVCMQCEFAGDTCRLMQRKPCLGPITQCGCKAVCTKFGQDCFGCRSFSADANITGLVAAAKLHGIPEEDIMRRISIFNARVLPAQLEKERARAQKKEKGSA